MKAELGAKNEHLTQFGVAPIRNRARKTKAQAAKPPGGATTTTTTPDTTKPAPAPKPAG